MYTIYQITNNVNNKIYIGFTKNTLDWRWRRHREQAKYDPRTYLHNAIRKHGPENFTRIALEKVETLLEAKTQEVFYIKKFKSNVNSEGYNLTEGGDGGEFSAETRRKMSLAHKGRGVHENNSTARKDISRKDVCFWYDFGLSTPEIARMFNTGDEVIRRRLMWNGVSRRQRRLESEEKEKITKLYALGLGSKRIAQVLNREQSSVSRFLRRTGTILRGSSGKRLSSTKEFRQASLTTYDQILRFFEHKPLMLN